MTLYDVARFVSSDAAPAFDALCRNYNLDPAASLGLEDDFLAWQLRYGLASSWGKDDEPAPETRRMEEGLARIAEARSLWNG